MASKELQKLLESIRAAGSFDGDLMTMRKMMSRAPAYPKPDGHHLGAGRRGGRTGGVGDPRRLRAGPGGRLLPRRRLRDGHPRVRSRPVLPPRSSDPGPPARGGLPAGAGAPVPRRRRRCRRRRTASPSRPATHPRPSRSAVTPPGAAWRSATLVALRDLGEPMPGTAVCLSPWTDLTLSGASLAGEPRRGSDGQRHDPRPHGRRVPGRASIGDRRPPRRCSRIWRGCRRCCCRSARASCCSTTRRGSPSGRRRPAST